MNKQSPPSKKTPKKRAAKKKKKKAASKKAPSKKTAGVKKKRKAAPIKANVYVVEELGDGHRVTKINSEGSTEEEECYTIDPNGECDCKASEFGSSRFPL